MFIVGLKQWFTLFSNNLTFKDKNSFFNVKKEKKQNKIKLLESNETQSDMARIFMKSIPLHSSELFEFKHFAIYIVIDLTCQLYCTI